MCVCVCVCVSMSFCCIILQLKIQCIFIFFCWLKIAPCWTTVGTGTWLFTSWTDLYSRPWTCDEKAGSLIRNYPIQGYFQNNLRLIDIWYDFHSYIVISLDGDRKKIDISKRRQCWGLNMENILHVCPFLGGLSPGLKWLHSSESWLQPSQADKPLTQQWFDTEQPTKMKSHSNKEKQ